ncbi:MAG TPA: hypothetical protein DEA08_27475 [Planctomycetes bacterium]|nr:hypothetical protein [Planctomycetota bacterium]|tara:strand:- start:51 stop:449 length:399 start_codon:yes stop_codon:yes gene_type:complete
MRRSASTPGFLGLLLSSSLLLGCPPAKTGKTDEPAKTGKTDAGETGKTGKQPAKDPLEGSVFSKDELFAIYRAYQTPDAEASRALLRKHRLIDPDGKEVAARVAAYDRALERYADLDREGWSAFIESLNEGK